MIPMAPASLAQRSNPVERGLVPSPAGSAGGSPARNRRAGVYPLPPVGGATRWGWATLGSHVTGAEGDEPLPYTTSWAAQRLGLAGGLVYASLVVP